MLFLHPVLEESPPSRHFHPVASYLKYSQAGFVTFAAGKQAWWKPSLFDAMCINSFSHNSLAYQKPHIIKGFLPHIHTTNPAWHPTLTVPVLGWALVISVCLLCRHVFTAHRPCFLPVSAEGWWISNSVSPCGRRSLHPPVPLLPYRQQAFGTNLWGSGTNTPPRQRGKQLFIQDFSGNM